MFSVLALPLPRHCIAPPTWARILVCSMNKSTKNRSNAGSLACTNVAPARERLCPNVASRFLRNATAAAGTVQANSLIAADRHDADEGADERKLKTKVATRELVTRQRESRNNAWQTSRGDSFARNMRHACAHLRRGRLFRFPNAQSTVPKNGGELVSSHNQV